MSGEAAAAPASAARPASFLGRAGITAATAGKHIVLGALLWSAVGLAVGIVSLALSFAAVSFATGRSAMPPGLIGIVLVFIPVLGTALFGIYGAHRGAARALLEVDRRFGLAEHLVEGMLARVQQHAGPALANLPLQQIEERVRQATSLEAASTSTDEPRGLFGRAVRRARRMLLPRVEAVFLGAFREQRRDDGTGGGISIEKVRERALLDTSQRLADAVMTPLKRQLWVLMALYVAFAASSWIWLGWIARPAAGA